MRVSITKSEINEKPLLAYSGEISLISEDAQVEEAVSDIQKETVLGFDTETRPAFRKGESYLPSLLQLGGESKVWIFQLQKLKHLTPVFSVLAQSEILKTGVAIHRDVLELRELEEFKPAGFQDVGKIAEKKGFLKTGLRPLAALLLDGRVSKGAQVSNWAASTLTEKQITYAATDAWVSRNLYLALQKVH